MDAFLARALNEMEAATRDASVDALRRHPPGKWSSADILDHLSRTFTSTAKLLDRHLQSGQPAADRRRLRHHLLRWAVIGAGLFPNGRPAPEFALPQGVAAEEALPRFREALTIMDAALARCEQRFGSSVPLASHFIFGPLTVHQWRKFHWIHTRHHAKQVRNLVIG